MKLIDIRAKRGPNPGGLVKVYLLPFSDLRSYPLADPDGIVRKSVQLKEGSRFFEYEFDLGKARLRSPSSGTDGGKYYTPGLDISIAGDDSEKLQLFGQMINGLFIVIVELPSGRRKLLGGGLCPALCSQADYDGGGDTDNYNGTSFRFDARGGMVQDYEGVIPLLPVLAPLTVQLEKTDVTTVGGADGTITTIAAGGEAPYTFTWSDGNTNQNRIGLPAGEYQVTVTDNRGTQTAATITIKEPSARQTAWRAKESSAYCVTE